MNMSTDIDIEGQQRAVEYTKLSAMKAKRSEIVEAVLEVMPPFPARGNALENLLKKKSEKSKDSAEQKSGSSDDDGSDEDEDEDEENNSGSENSDSEEENNAARHRCRQLIDGGVAAVDWVEMYGQK